MMDCEICDNSPVVKLINGKNHCEDCAYEAQMPDYLKQLGVLPVFWGARLTQCPGLPYEMLDKSLFITGDVGTGKTHMAVAMLVDYIKGVPFSKVKECDFVTMLGLLDEIKGSFGKSVGEQLNLINHYCEIEYLVIDDIGVELPSDWAMTHIYRIINTRWGCDKQTIFTSNFNYKQLEKKLDARIVSRVMGMCEVVELTGNDLRKRR
jgi:DNA replication protein DnaC